MSLLLIGSFLCIAIGLGIAFFSQRKSQNSPPTPTSKKDNFAAEMLSELQGLFPDAGFAYDARSDMIEPPEGYSGEHDYKIFLGNLRNRAQDMGREERHQFIREMIMTFTDRSEITAEELKANLFLRARTGTELSLRNILLASPDAKPSTPAAINRGDIILEVVMDIPNGVRMVDQETLTEHEVTLEDGVNLAATNLLRITPDSGDDLWEKIDENVWISKPHDDYDAARLFTFPEQMRLPFKGKAAAYVPSHSIVLITDKRDEATFKTMMDFGASAAETHRPLSFDIWEQVDEGWKKMTSPDRASLVYKASVESSGRAYAEQKEVLEQVFEAKEKDIFVASVMMMKNTDTGEYTTLAVFIDGHSYLPIVDYIIPQLGGAGNKEINGKIKWDRFVEILGQQYLVAVPGLEPERYEFTGSIPSEMRAELNKAGEPV
jgi:hypothetical protein